MDFNMLIMPVVIVVVEVIKRTEKISKNWLPAVAVGTGIVIGAVFALIEPEKAVEHVINGLLYGASAAGIYDLGKSTVILAKSE